MRLAETIKRVRKYEIDDSYEREEYEKLLNNTKCMIYREEFMYDKAGRAFVTVWFEEEV